MKGTATFSLSIFNGLESETPMWIQLPQVVSLIRQVISNNSKLFEGGYHFVGHSQGGLMLRCVIEEMDDHKVQHFVSLAGVQQGYYVSSKCLFLSASNLSNL